LIKLSREHTAVVCNNGWSYLYFLVVGLDDDFTVKPWFNALYLVLVCYFLYLFGEGSEIELVLWLLS